MIRKQQIKLAVVALLLLFISCGKRQYGIEQPDSTYTVADTPVSGLSGICFNAAKTGFYAVSDKTGIYEHTVTGTLVRRLPYEGGRDLEAVSLHPLTHKLILADESLMDILQLTDSENGLLTLAHIDITGGVSNKGLEGLSCGPDTMYIVNQASPCLLIKYVLSTGEEAARIPISFAVYLSDIFYDNTDQTLWICDSEQKQLFHCSNSGRLLSSQSISFIQKAEALVIDRDAGVAWIGCDATGKLYRVTLQH